MRDYLTLGCTPCDEECAQVGSDDYTVKSMQECEAYRHQLERKFQKVLATSGVRLQVKTFPHDFGSYREVVVSYDDQNEGEVETALAIERELPEDWDAEATKELEKQSDPKAAMECEICDGPAITNIVGVGMCAECSMDAEDSGL